MIWESHYWKNDLLKQADQLRKRSEQKRWPDVSLAKLEQTIMLGFYSVRKLTEASKLSDEVVKQNIRLNTFPRRKGSSVHRMNWERIDKHYDLSSEGKINRNLLYLCNQFIHSYIFVPAFDNANRLKGIYFASDRQRGKSLYFIAIGKIIEVFDQVGNDYPTKVSIRFDFEKQEYKISSTTHQYK